MSVVCARVAAGFEAAAPGVPSVAGFAEFGFTTGLLAPLAGGFGDAVVEPAAGAASGDFAAFASAGLSGTDGNRCARISTARVFTASAEEGSRETTSVMTSTSSSLARFAAGCRRMLRKSSWPGETLVTIPTGRPFG